MPGTPFGPIAALRRHWPVYAIEAWALGMFMISASVATVLLYDPRSPVVHLIDNEFWKRAVMALALAGTAVGIVCSPRGKSSGAHMNPALTLSFWLWVRSHPSMRSGISWRRLSVCSRRLFCIVACSALN